MERLFGGIRVDRSEGSGVARIERIEKRSRFCSPDFAQDDPVGTPAQGRPQEIVKRDAGLKGIGLAFDAQNVGFLNVKLSRILDNYNPFLVRNCLRQDIEQGGLSRPRSATDKGRFCRFESGHSGIRQATGSGCRERLGHRP